MLISECMERMGTLLREEEIPFALAGGIAASLYRSEPRMTGDVDFVIAIPASGAAKAKSIMRKMGFEPGLLRQAQLVGGPLFSIKNKSTPVVMVIGREKGNPQGVGADLLLSEIPWVHSALERSRNHQVDFGFGLLPVLTLEDVILSKLYAIGHFVNRPKDLDDLQSILLSSPDMDVGYLKTQIVSCDIRLTRPQREALPSELQALF